MKAEEILKAAGGMNRGGWEVIRRKWSDVCYRAKHYSRNRAWKNVTGAYIITK